MCYADCILTFKQTNWMWEKHKAYNMPMPFEFSGFGAKNFDTPLPTLYSGVEIPISEIAPFSAYWHATKTHTLLEH